VRNALLIAAIALLATTSFAPAQATRPVDRAAWMRDAKWGVMTHYLADWIARRESFNGGRMTVERWNELVDKFDVDALAEQIETLGAKYYIMTIGQNSGFYLSPNATYDRIVGNQPSKCSRRDLIGDLADAFAKRGIKLLVYLPAGAPSGDRVARDKLQWQNGAHPNREFQHNWEQIIAEWSTRWGTKVHGWWFDGCYWPNTMYRSDAPPNFASFAAAARAGNPNSAVAFNPGVVYRTMSITPHEDYIAGEIDQPEKQSIKRVGDGGMVDGARLHMLSYLGQRWGGGSPRFAPQQVVDFTRRTVDAGGFVTWDVPIRSDGTIAREFMDQLEAVAAAMRQPSPRPTSAATQQTTRGD
jgi:alpha-L-fucosidase